MNNSSNHVYYDLNIVNNNQDAKTEPPRLVFNDIRNSNILSNPSDYYLSVVRFTLQTANSIPIWIPEIDVTDNLMADKTIYSFTLKYNGFSSDQRYVYYEAENNLAPPVMPIRPGDSYNLPYYYVSNFDHVVEMLNGALSASFADLYVKVLNGGGNMPSNNPPFIEWNFETGKMIFNADVLGYNVDQSALGHIEIYCNTSMKVLLSGFRSRLVTVDSPDGSNYKLIIKKDINELNLYKLPTYTAIQLYQQYGTGALFNPVSSIVFTSALIPVVSTNTSKPTIYNGNNNLMNSGNNSNISSMLTDFEVQDSNGYGYCSQIEYVPSGEYRLIDLQGGGNENALQNIEISVFWKDAYSNLHPLYIQPGCRCDLKIMFRKKSYQSTLM